MPTTSPTFIVLTELVGHAPASLNQIQAVIAPHVHSLTVTWLALWCTALVFAIRALINKIRFPELDVPSTTPSISFELPPILTRIRVLYRRLFSVSEIEHSLVLRWLYGAMLFGFFTSFGNWILDSSITAETASKGAQICWTYFPQCGQWYVLHTLPYGYSYTSVYMVLYAVMLACVFAMWKKSWTSAHALMMILFVWKVLVMFVLTASIQGGPNYHHVLITFVLLFLPYKEFFARVSFVVMYFLSAVIKLDESWILGEYFTSLQSGLPVFGNTLAPIFTNAVIGMQIILGWFLLSGRSRIQKTALVCFSVFHIYAGIFVGYTYPILALSMLWILFGPLFHVSTIPLNRRSVAGWITLIALFAFHAPAHLIEGDQRMTQEGSRFGLNLFDANHQCASTLSIYATSSTPVRDTQWSAKPRQTCGDYICLTTTITHEADDMVVTRERWESPVSWQRCRVSTFWSIAKQQHCSDPGVLRVQMQFDHSIDGGPFYRIVDEQNICTLSYQTFSHNGWIKMPPEAPIVGYPVKNVFRYQRQSGSAFNERAPQISTSSDIIALNELVGNDRIQRTSLQSAVAPYFPVLVFFWRVIWTMMCALVISRVWFAYQRTKK